MVCTNGSKLQFYFVCPLDYLLGGMKIIQKYSKGVLNYKARINSFCIPLKNASCIPLLRRGKAILIIWKLIFIPFSHLEKIYDSSFSLGKKKSELVDSRALKVLATVLPRICHFAKGLRRFIMQTCDHHIMTVPHPTLLWIFMNCRKLDIALPRPIFTFSLSHWQNVHFGIDFSLVIS